MRKGEDVSAPVIVIFRLWKLPFYLVEELFNAALEEGWKIKGDERKCFAKIILFSWNKLRSKILSILRHYFLFFIFFLFFLYFLFFLFFFFFIFLVFFFFFFYFLFFFFFFLSLTQHTNTARNTLEKKDKFCRNETDAKNIKYFAKIILFP